MAERTAPSVDRALAGVAAEIDVPPTPALAVSVVSRLLADRAAETRPVLPRRALWSPRTRLIAATAAIVALLAIAAGARYVIGVAEIRIEPERTPSGPPIAPASLGDPTPLAELEEAVGFAVQVPSGRAPDAAWASPAGGGPRSSRGDRTRVGRVCPGRRGGCSWSRWRAATTRSSSSA